MFSTYRPSRFPGSMAVFRAEYTVDGFEHLPDLGWTGYAEQSLEILRVPGTHSSFLRLPHVKLVAEKLQTLLANALQGQAAVHREYFTSRVLPTSTASGLTNRR